MSIYMHAYNESQNLNIFNGLKMTSPLYLILIKAMLSYYRQFPFGIFQFDAK